MTKLIVPRATGPVTRQQLRAAKRRAIKTQRPPTQPPEPVMIPLSEIRKHQIAGQVERALWYAAHREELEAHARKQHLLEPIRKPERKPQRTEMGLWTP